MNVDALDATEARDEATGVCAADNSEPSYRSKQHNTNAQQTHIGTTVGVVKASCAGRLDLELPPDVQIGPLRVAFARKPKQSHPLHQHA